MMLQRKPLASAVSLAMLLLAAPAWADEGEAARLNDQTTAKTKADKKANQGEGAIVVTASKRAQTASKVPYNVSAISEEQLREEHITDAKKLIQQTIGINAPGNPARFADSVTVRGLNVSPVNANNIEYFVRSTLAYYLDDTPLPNMGYRIKDVARVETLLGPQGTLYGAGSLGGTIRYITNRPQLGKDSLAVHSDGSHTQGAAGISWDNDVVINKAIGENFALRASISSLNERGYTDRLSNPPWRNAPATPASSTSAWTTSPDPKQNLYKGDDYQDVAGGRVSALWRIQPGVEVLAAHAQQHQFAHGTSGASILPVSRACAGLPKPCPYDSYHTPFAVNDHTVLGRYEEYAQRDFSLDSLDLDIDLSFAKLHSSTSKFEDSRNGQADYAAQGFLYYGWLGHGEDSGRSAYMTFNNTFKGISHETRLVSKGDGPLSWIGGFYYTKQDKNLQFSEMLPGLDTTGKSYYVYTDAPGRLVDEGYRESLVSHYKETALYGEASYKLTDAWQVTGGVRTFHYEDEGGSLINDYTSDLFKAQFKTAPQAKGNKSYFRFNTSYQFNPDMLGYFTASQGFRRGGSNGFKTPYKSVDTGTTLVVRPDAVNYQPDSTDNFELGLKGYLFDKRLYVQTDVYRINWKDVQTYFAQSIGTAEVGTDLFPINGTTNGPKAHSQGWELSTRYKLTDNLTLNFATTTTKGVWDGTKTQCMYVGDNSKDCRTWSTGGLLGGAPKWTHQFGVRYWTELENDMSFSAGLSGRYVGEVRTDRTDSKTETAPFIAPSYTLLNANASLSRDDWNLGLYVLNLANKRALVSNQAQGVMGRRMIYAMPRTIGLNFGYSFQ